MQDNEKGGCPRFPFGPGRPLEMEPEYARLRRDEPVTRVELPFGGNAWLLTRMTDTRDFLSDSRLSRQEAVGDSPRYTQIPISEQGGIPVMDPPDHTRARRLLTRAFKERRIETMRPRVAEMVDDLIDKMMASGPPADLVTQFGSILPSQVICLLLGVPYEDWDTLGRHVNTLVQVGAAPMGEVIASSMALGTYFTDLTAARRADPQDDLISAMTTVTHKDDAFTDDDIMMNAIVLFISGADTTACQIVNSVCALLRHPDQLAWLRENLDAIPGAVDELLRFVPLLAANPMASVTTEDVEIGGVTIPKGDAVFPCPASANRDESVFDRPDEFDIHRGPEVKQHIAFGYGPRYCLGAGLARVELETSLEGILRRMPNLGLAVPEAELPPKAGLVLRGFDSFPVTW
jgi:cytochrome P450